VILRATLGHETAKIAVAQTGSPNKSMV